MRATKLTPELAARLCDARRSGLNYEQCAESAGISPRYISRWRQAAENGREPFATFARMWREAEAALEAAMIEKFRNPGVAA